MLDPDVGKFLTLIPNSINCELNLDTCIDPNISIEFIVRSVIDILTSKTRNFVTPQLQLNDKYYWTVHDEHTNAISYVEMKNRMCYTVEAIHIEKELFREIETLRKDNTF